MTCGIYVIENTKTGEAYIGQSQRIQGRWRDHISNLERGAHHCKLLQKAWFESEPTDFTFRILEVCAYRDLNKEEVKAISGWEGSLYNSELNLGSVDIDLVIDNHKKDAGGISITQYGLFALLFILVSNVLAGVAMAQVYFMAFNPDIPRGEILATGAIIGLIIALIWQYGQTVYNYRQELSDSTNGKH